jgi:hypothetical protein
MYLYFKSPEGIHFLPGRTGSTTFRLFIESKQI